MNRVNIKPLSVNKAWQGRRFKTQDYKDYEEELLYILPKIEVPEGKKYKLKMLVGFSNRNSDLSNSIKQFEDVLCKKYGFDDRYIFEISMKKEIVKKGEEFISFSLTDIDNIV